MRQSLQQYGGQTGTPACHAPNLSGKLTRHVQPDKAHRRPFYSDAGCPEKPGRERVSDTSGGVSIGADHLQLTPFRILPIHAASGRYAVAPGVPGTKGRVFTSHESAHLRAAACLAFWLFFQRPQNVPV
ncbi:hypothetical protein MRX96_010514 [Rhipicephalus microplus]